MKFFETLRRWATAMEDVEDPRGAELRCLHRQVRTLERRDAAPEVDGGAKR